MPDYTSSLSLPRVKRKWSHRTELLMSCIASSVGLGNLWRFPFVCYENGGGAFLIPYFIIVTLIGRPLYHLDLAMGQFSGCGPLMLYNQLGKAWTGVAISQAICCISVFSYYAYVIAVVLVYFGKSFAHTLPWTRCYAEYGDLCTPDGELSENATVSPAELYLNKIILHKAETLDEHIGLGMPAWHLVAALVVVWSLACLYDCWGIKSSGKVAYFTALVPYVILFILMIRVLTLPGAIDGVEFFFVPDWNKLFTIKVWLAATAQCFFSLGVGYGILSMYASYNYFDDNINIVSMTVAVVDTLTSLLGGVVCFSTLGILAKEMKTSVSEVLAGGGMRMAFISYAMGVSKFPLPQIFSAIFFFMLATLGCGSLNGYQQVITTNMLEVWPKMKEWQAAIIVSLLGFLSSIVYTTPCGEIALDMVDTYGNTYVIGLLASAQIVAMIFVYGLKNLCWDIRFMIHRDVNIYWRWTWAIFTPIILIFMYLLTYVFGDRIEYNGHPVANYVQCIAIAFMFFFSLPVFLTIAYYLYKNRKQGFKESVRMAYSTKSWVPADEEILERLTAFKEDRAEKYKYAEDGHIKQTFRCLISKP